MKFLLLILIQIFFISKAYSEPIRYGADTILGLSGQKELQLRYDIRYPNPKFFVGLMGSVEVNQFLSRHHQEVTKRYKYKGGLIEGGPIPGEPRYREYTLPAKPLISPVGGLEIGYKPDNFTYIISASLNNVAYSNADEYYERSILSFWGSITYDFYRYSRNLNFYSGVSLGLSFSNGNWRYPVLIPDLDVSEERIYNVSQASRLDALLVGINLGLEYKINRVLSIIVDNMVFHSAVESSNNYTSKSSKIGGESDYLIFERANVDSFKSGFGNRLTFKIRFYMF